MLVSDRKIVAKAPTRLDFDACYLQPREGCGKVSMIRKIRASGEA